MVTEIKKRKWRIFMALAIVSVVIPIIIVVYSLIFTDKESVVFLEDCNPILGVLIILYYLVVFSIGIVWVVKQILAILKLKNELKKNELKHLQSQVNPHFFFNVLNNLYGMVGKDAEKARQLILKLSEMMRYSIHDGQKDFVTIVEEIDYLKQYLSLHQMRYHKIVDVQFETDIENEQLKVTPLLFIILVENAFKHGVENLRTNAYVHLKLKVGQDYLNFEVVNNFDSGEIRGGTGVGLKNLKKRLELVYPDKYILSVSKTDKVYKAMLTLRDL